MKIDTDVLRVEIAALKSESHREAATTQLELAEHHLGSVRVWINSAHEYVRNQEEIEQVRREVERAGA